MNRPVPIRPPRWTSGSTRVAARRSAPPLWLALALACAMLWAQWAGLVHRIEHGVGLGSGAAHAVSVQHERAASRSVIGADAGPAGLHSCVVFDGLCLADSLPTALMPVLPRRGVHAVPPLSGFLSWQASVVRHFQSRAPPAA
ncbi:MAG: hypothetical protein EOP40_13320 [Rubrivivax sp.]|nr:MAG: hypothetical protein EOP40_13320 [Rubrivivax sp.]